jgi:hypothetical protein
MRVRYLKVSDSKMFHLSSYPNFSASGSVIGMKRDFYGKNALLVRCGSYIYKVPSSIYYSAK